MRHIWVVMLLSVGSVCATADVEGASSAGLPTPLDDELREKLRDQQILDVRRRSSVPASRDPAAGVVASEDLRAAEENDKLRHVQRLLIEVERRRGFEPGTQRLRRVPEASTQFELLFDSSKLSRNAAAGGGRPFGIPADVAGTISSVEPAVELRSPASVEYRNKVDRSGAEQVVAVKSERDVAATAFRSGETPVQVDVETAKLTAKQVNGTTAELPVDVKVNGVVRRMRPGEIARFGQLEVLVQTSSNLTATTHREGPPYALRLRIQTVP